MFTTNVCIKHVPGKCLQIHLLNFNPFNSVLQLLQSSICHLRKNNLKRLQHYCAKQDNMFKGQLIQEHFHLFLHQLVVTLVYFLLRQGTSDTATETPGNQWSLEKILYSPLANTWLQLGLFCVNILSCQKQLVWLQGRNAL